MVSMYIQAGGAHAAAVVWCMCAVPLVVSLESGTASLNEGTGVLHQSLLQGQEVGYVGPYSSRQNLDSQRPLFSKNPRHYWLMVS
jgi:hypothetical protein